MGFAPMPGWLKNYAKPNAGSRGIIPLAGAGQSPAGVWGGAPGSSLQELRQLLGGALEIGPSSHFQHRAIFQKLHVGVF
jgi:hypothetical protein